MNGHVRAFRAACALSLALGGCAVAPGAVAPGAGSPGTAAVGAASPANAASPRARAPVPARVTDIAGADHVNLKVYEYGNLAGPPIVFIHGVNQAHIAWNRQFADGLAARYRLVAFDLRGHGFSGKPAEAAAYQSEKKWADDLAAVIDGLKLSKPVLVGWSYGGRVIAMYLRHYGSSNVGAVDFVDTVLRVGGQAAGQRSPAVTAAVGKIMRARSIQDYIEGQAAFVRVMTWQPLPRDEFEQVLAFNMHVPPQVFKAVVGAGPFDFEPELSRLRVPTLVTHGAHDLVSNVANGRFIAEHVPGARLSIFENAGHMSFLEDPARFDRELDALAREAGASVATARSSAR